METKTITTDDTFTRMKETGKRRDAAAERLCETLKNLLVNNPAKFESSFGVLVAEKVREFVAADRDAREAFNTHFGFGG